MLKWLFLCVHWLLGATACKTGLSPGPNGTCVGSLAGLMRITDEGEKLGDIWLQITTAALLAVEHINQRNFAVVPDAESVIDESFRLSFDLHDSASSPASGLQAMTKFLGQSPPPLGVLGPARSAVSQSVSLIASIQNMPVLSYWSSSPQLSKRELYPSFGRIYPSDELQAKALADTVQHFKWKKLAFLYPNDEYGRGMFNKFLFLVKGTDIVVHASHTFDYGNAAEHIDSGLKNFKVSDIRVIIAVVFDSDMPELLESARRHEMTSHKYTWVGSETFGGGINSLDPVPKQQMETFLKGAIRTFPQLGEGPGWTQFQVEWRKQDGNVPAFQHYYSDNNLTYNLKNGSNSLIVLPSNLFATACPDLCAAAYDAVFSYAMAINRDELKDATDGIALLKSMSGVSFGGCGSNVSFDQSYERDLSTVQILLQQFKDANSSWQKAGYYDPHTNAIVSTVPITWKDGTTVVPLDSPQEIEVNLFVSDSVVVVFQVAATLGLLWCVYLVWFHHRYKDEQLIRASSPNINQISIIGAVMIYIGMFFFLEAASDTTPGAFTALCNARMWFMLIGYGLFLSPFLAKMYRLHLIFNGKSRRRKRVKDRHLFAIVAGFLAVDLLFMLVWTVVCPWSSDDETIKEEINDHADTISQQIVQKCNCVYLPELQVIAALHKGLLVVIGAYYAFVTRNISNPIFNDSQALGIALYNNAFTIVIAVALLFVFPPKTHPDLIQGLLVFAMWYLAFSTHLIVFGPKLWNIHRPSVSPNPIQKVTPLRNTAAPSEGSDSAGSEVISTEPLFSILQAGTVQQLRLRKHRTNTPVGYIPILTNGVGSGNAVCLVSDLLKAAGVDEKDNPISFDSNAPYMTSRMRLPSIAVGQDSYIPAAAAQTEARSSKASVSLSLPVLSEADESPPVE